MILAPLVISFIINLSCALWLWLHIFSKQNWVFTGFSPISGFNNLCYMHSFRLFSCVQQHWKAIQLRTGTDTTYIGSSNLHTLNIAYSELPLDLDLASIYSLGQLDVLQSVLWEFSSPSQSDPPFCGAGSVQVRDRDLSPPAQLTEQSPQLDHCAQLPAITQI